MQDRHSEKLFYESISQYHPFKQNLMLRQRDIYDTSARPDLNLDPALATRLYYDELARKQSKDRFSHF